MHHALHCDPGMSRFFDSCNFLPMASMVFNGCEIFGKAIDNPRLMAKFNLSINGERMMNTCIYANSSGDFANIVEQANITNANEFKLANTILGGFSKEAARLGFTNTTQDLLLAQYGSFLSQKLVSNQEVDKYEVSPNFANIQIAAENVAANIKKSVTTFNDIFTNKESTCGSLAKSPPTATSATQDLCIIMPSTPFANFAQRPWFSATTQPMKDSIQNLTKAEDSYTTIIKDFTNEVSSTAADSLLSKEDALLSKYKSAVTEYASIITIWKDVTDFVDSDPINSNINALFNCRIVRSQVLYVRYAICNDFVNNFGMQSFYLGLLGLVTSILGVFMCIQLRLIDRDKNKLPAHMKKDSEPTVEMNELML